MKNLLYVASCRQDGGVIVFDNDGNNTQSVAELNVGMPMYMANSDGLLYVLSNLPVKPGDTDGSLCVYGINEQGIPGALQRRDTTYGQVPCHIAVQNGNVYITNYASSSVIMMPEFPVVHLGSGISKTRQTEAHPHGVCFTPDRRYLLVSDLGLDRIIVYDLCMAYVSDASVPQGHGCRHLVFSTDGEYLYSVNEMASTVSAFAYSGGRLFRITTVNALPYSDETRSTAAAIRVSPDGKMLYTSNRGDDSISCFALENYIPRLVETVSTHGASPRDFIISRDGSALYCCNEGSDTLVFFDMKNGIPEYRCEISVPSPVSVLEVPIK